MLAGCSKKGTTNYVPGACQERFFTAIMLPRFSRPHLIAVMTRFATRSADLLAASAAGFGAPVAQVIIAVVAVAVPVVVVVPDAPSRSGR